MLGFEQSVPKSNIDVDLVFGVSELLALAKDKLGQARIPLPKPCELRALDLLGLIKNACDTMGN